MFYILAIIVALLWFLVSMFFTVIFWCIVALIIIFAMIFAIPSPFNYIALFIYVVGLIIMVFKVAK